MARSLPSPVRDRISSRSNCRESEPCVDRTAQGAEVGVAGQGEEAREAGHLGQKGGAAVLVVGRGRLEPALEGRLQLGLDLDEPGLHLPERDEREDWLGVLIGPERRVGPELIGRRDTSRRSTDIRPPVLAALQSYPALAFVAIRCCGIMPHEGRPP